MIDVCLYIGLIIIIYLFNFEITYLNSRTKSKAERRKSFYSELYFLGILLFPNSNVFVCALTFLYLTFLLDRKHDCDKKNTLDFLFRLDNKIVNCNGLP